MANETVNLGWLKDYNDTKFAPKTTLSSVLSAGGSADSVVMTGAADKNSLTTRALTNNTSNNAAAANTNIPTMNTLYYTLAKINNADQTHATTIYAPTSAGTLGYVLQSAGGTSAPTWVDAEITDEKVKQQSATTQTGYYPVLFSGKSTTESGGGTTDRTGTIYFNTSVTIKPNTGILMGAAWNDYAEYRQTAINIEPGRCIYELGNDILELTTERLQRGCEIVSDTFGFAIGETDECKTPVATSGRVLAYLYEGREAAAAHIGWPVCSGPNGTVSIMTPEEEEKYPSRIIGTISAVPDYEVWGSGNVKVNGRIWIRIR